MKNTKSTKHALLTSVMALFLCVTMLLGTTFAWFTDTVTSGVNTIVAGNLDIEVQYSTNGTSWADLEGTRSLFSDNLWEPGHTEIVYLKITNAGTLALNYKVLVTPVSESGGVNVAGESFKLSDYLVFGTTAPSETLTTYTRDTAREAVAANGMGLNVNNLTKSKTMVGKTDAATDVQYLALVVYMPENVGNEANYKTGTAAPTIELGIKVVATQLGSENDSFGNDYDNGAVSTPFYTVGAYYNYFPQVSASAPVVAGGNTVITATGKLNSTDTVDTTLATVTVPSGAALVPGTTKLTVNVVPAKAGASTETGLVANGETAANGRETANFDIKVEGIATTNTANINVEVFVGKGLANVKVYHNGALISGTNYDPDTGIVTFTTTSFSDYTVTYDTAVAAIGPYTYRTLAQAVEAANSGETITLLRDVHCSSTVIIPDRTTVTLDLNGKAITVDTKPGDSTRHFYAIDNYGTFTLMDSSLEQTGSITARGIENLGSGKMIVNGGTIISCDANGGASIWNEADLTINGGTFTTVHVGSASDSFGVGCLNNSGTALITGGTFIDVNKRTYAIISTGDITITPAEGKTVTVNGAHGGLAIDGGVAVVNGGNYSSTDYYGLYVSNDGQGLDPVTAAVTVNGGTFDGKAYSVWIGSDHNVPVNSTISITGGTFNKPLNAQNCTREGAIVINGGTFSSDPSEYVPEGNTVIREENAYKVLRGVFVSTEEELKEALASNFDVIFSNDFTIVATKGGYNNAGLVLGKGGMIDGNDKKLTVSGANGTWDCGVYTKGGTIKNLTISGPFRGVFGSGIGQDVVIENCDIDAVYPFNHDGGSTYSLIVKNSVLHGWTSYGGIKAAHFIETEFSLGNSGYDCVAAYTDTFFTDCTFDENFVVYAQVAGFTFTFENCVKNGVTVTAENFKTLFPDDSDVWTKCTCIVNGVTVTP